MTEQDRAQIRKAATEFVYSGLEGQGGETNIPQGVIEKAIRRAEIGLEQLGAAPSDQQRLKRTG